MLNLATLQKLNSFHRFAQCWRNIAGTELLLISVDGQTLANGRHAPRLDWSEPLQQASPHQPTSLIDQNQPLLIAPLCYNNQTLGYLLALDPNPQNISLLAWGAETMVTHLVDQEALQGMTDELIGAWDQLELIYRVTQNLALTSNLITALKSILQEIQKVVDTEDGFILLQHANTLDYVTCTGDSTQNFDPKTLLNNLIDSGHIVLCQDIAACRQLWPEAPPHLENLLATHLFITEEDAQAALGLINKTNKIFTAGDVKLLAALAQQVGTIIKNFLIHQKLIVEERLSRELEIAAEIQTSLLPTRLPQVSGLALAVTSIPASEVGGDFYDFITTDDHQLTLIMGDVAGKGIPAAMLTSLTRTMLRVEAIRGEPPHAIIQQANGVLHQDLNRADSFVTVFVAAIDALEGTLSYASAGHMPAILWHAKTRLTQQLKATSPPLGILNYQEGGRPTLSLSPGDTLVFYTDGVTEAQAPNGDFFGLERLLRLIESKACESPEMLLQSIQAEMAGFCQNASGQDDVTLLIVKMMPPSDLLTHKHLSTMIKTADFSYPADTRYLTDILTKITTTCRELPALPADSRADDFIHLIELAISEICTNIIKHAYAYKKGDIRGRITLLKHGIALDFYDTGASFDPSAIPEPKSDPSNLVEGGYGLRIVRQIVDIMSYQHDPAQGHNHWYLMKSLPWS